jgi:hypothetical protein
MMFPRKILYPIKMLTGNERNGRMLGERNEVDFEFLIHQNTNEFSSGPTDADSVTGSFGIGVKKTQRITTRNTEQ